MVHSREGQKNRRTVVETRGTPLCLWRCFVRAGYERQPEKLRAMQAVVLLSRRFLPEQASLLQSQESSAYPRHPECQYRRKTFALAFDSPVVSP